MTIAELQQVLLTEHNRERKIVIRNYITGGVLALIVICAALFFLMPQMQKMANEISGVPLYVKLMIPAGLLLTAGYTLYGLNKLRKRPLDIMKLGTILQSGSKATTIVQQTVYKTHIPLGRIRIRMNPFEYLFFSLEGKNYQVPAPPLAIPEIKAILSGANMQKVQAVWGELYSGETTTQTTVAAPLKSAEEFNAYAAQELTAPLSAMEKGRKKTLTILVAAVVVIFGIMGFIWTRSYHQSNDDAKLLNGTPEGVAAYNAAQSSSTYKILGAFGVVCVLCYGYMMYARKKYAGQQSGQDATGDFTAFKDQIFKKIVHFINPEFEYVQHSHIGLPELLETGMFSERYYDVTGNDLIVGKHNGVAFQYCDLSVHRQKNFSNEREGPAEVFKGQYFVARFNKSFDTPVYVTARVGAIKNMFTGNELNSYLSLPEDKVILEDPEFMKLFDVNCKDQVAARYILTPSMMQRVKELAQHSKNAKLYIAFCNNKITVANNHREDRFETGITTSLTPELLTTFYKEICDQFSIIDELKLNINIWRRQPDTNTV